MTADAVEPMPHLFALAVAALGTAIGYVLAANGDHLTALLVAVIAAAPGVLTWRETRRNRAEIRKRRTIVTRGDTQVTITDEELDDLADQEQEH
jgi:hypothetical protein